MAIRRQVLLRRSLAAGGELGHGAPRRRLGHLPAGVGVDLGVEHQDVDVAARRQHVVEAAVADVVGPAVAADDPDALLRPACRPRPAGRGPRGVVRPRAGVACSSRDALALRVDAGLAWSGRPRGSPRDQLVADRPRPAARAARGRTRPACRGPGACPGRTRRCPRTASWTRPGRARRGWSSRAWSAGCRRRSTSSRWRWRSAARSPNSWRQQLEIRRLAAAGAGAGELEQRLQQLRRP